MNHHYNDIRSKIAEPPIWWDENAVPRYCEFTPHDTADIYARECCLLRIACQDCRRPFDVAMSVSALDIVVGRVGAALADDIRSGEIHYGDPPNVDCCPSGPTMNSVPRRVLQFWRGEAGEWTRDASLEVEIDCEWDK